MNVELVFIGLYPPQSVLRFNLSKIIGNIKPYSNDSNRDSSKPPERFRGVLHMEIYSKSSLHRNFNVLFIFTLLRYKNYVIYILSTCLRCPRHKKLTRLWLSVASAQMGKLEIPQIYKGFTQQTYLKYDEFKTIIKMSSNFGI